jgi:hypothetical protein
LSAASTTAASASQKSVATNSDLIYHGIPLTKIKFFHYIAFYFVLESSRS